MLESPVASPALGVVGIVSVNVAIPSVLGMRRDEAVMSAIRKQPVPKGGVLRLTRENLAGDLQADLDNHGGPNKAVYCHPSEHYPLWNAELAPDPPYGPGRFGENITTSGWTEREARIGDIWRWGTATLQICQPRYPCFKLAMTTERMQVVKRMLETLRNGWYLRVLEPGEVPVDGPIEVFERGPATATVRDAVRAILPDAPRELTEYFADLEVLAPSWRNMAARALDGR